MQDQASRHGLAVAQLAVALPIAVAQMTQAHRYTVTLAQLAVAQMAQSRSGNGLNGAGMQWQWPKWYRHAVAVAQMVQSRSGGGSNGTGTQWQWLK
eukprot:scaffold154428_cov21-Tisochrysis_lutea.AAC.1